MKFIQRILKVLVPAAAILPLLTGCSNGGYVLGGKYLDSSIQTLIIDTCTVRMTTMSIDSVNTTNQGLGLVGQYYNPYFGKVKATTYVSYNNPGVPSFVSNKSYTAIFDSVALVMTLNGSYLGDTTVNHVINVYALDETIEMPVNGSYSSKTTYYYSSADSVSYKPTPIATYTVVPRPKTNFKASSSFPYYTHTNHFFVRLPDSLGIGLLNRMSDNHDGSIILDKDVNKKRWRNYFKGLAVTAGSDNDAVLGFKVRTDTKSDSLFAIRIFYHYSLKTRIKGTINILVDEDRNFYGLKHDRSGTPFSALGSTTKELRTSSSNDIGMVQALSTSYVKIEFPYLNKLLELGDYGSIVDAALLVYPVEDSYTESMPLPSKLSLFESNEQDATIAQVTNSSGTTLTGNLYKDPLYRSKTYYSYDITTFLNDQLGTSTIYKRNLQLTPPSDTVAKCLNTMILGDQRYRKDATRLIVKYLIYENK